MRKVTRVLVCVVSALVVIVAVLLLIGYLSLRQSLPQTSGELHLAGLKSSVEVVRDDLGVPHVFAANEEDLFFAQGFVTAQDRFWQMDLHRRVASGRLAEIFGRDLLDFDRLMRTVGIHHTAAEIYAQLPSESQRILDAYAAGVNAFLTDKRHKLPVECRILRYRPSEWKREDSIAYVRFMSWTLNLAWVIDLTYAALSEKLGWEMVQEILPTYPASAPRVVSQGDESLAPVFLSLLQINRESRGKLNLDPRSFGSNNWVINGSKTETGKPLLCNDPHLAFFAPAVWYEIHLSGAGYDVCGVSFAGVPGVIIGHNRHIAWGMTNAMIDDADFFLERIDPGDSTRYERDGEWKTMSVIGDTIRIKGEDPIRHDVFVTDHGPLIDRVHPLAKHFGKGISLRWTGHDFSDDAAALREIMRAQNWQEFIDALSHFGTPAQNFVYADVDGNIGYCLGGAIPFRKKGDGLLLRRGWLSDDDWQGTLPFEENPRLLNPSSGFIATANNEITDEKHVGYLSAYWEPPDRIERILQLQQEKPKLNVQDCQRMQLDLYSVRAQKIVPLLLRALEESGIPDHGHVNDAYGLLRAWDFEENIDSIPAAIFHTFYRNLLHNIFADEMGKGLYTEFVSFSGLALRVCDKLLESGDSRWFDDTSTEDVTESLNDILVESLEDGLEELETLLGDGLNDWQWGRLHQVAFPHAFEQVPVLGEYFCIGPFPIGGCYETINNAGYSLTEPYRSTWGVSTRQIVDLDDPAAALSVIPTGQSGCRFNKHYQDQTELWLNGKYHSVLMNREAIMKGEHKVLLLYPNQSGE